MARDATAESNRVGVRLLDEGTSNFAQTIAYYEMAYNLAEMEEDLDRALDYAHRSLELAPDELKEFPLAALGWVHYKRREFEQAVRVPRALDRARALADHAHAPRHGAARVGERGAGAHRAARGAPAGRARGVAAGQDDGVPARLDPLVRSARPSAAPSRERPGMRWSRFYLFTTREDPGDAEVVSHRLMARSGMLRKLAAGIYVYAPLALRTIAKLEAIVRAEMNKAGGVELLMPAIQPSSLWIESGRWEQYGKELLRIKDRHEREFCFGPTHEEVITDLVRADVRSYRQLPFLLYQIQTKFRDEIRPRFGLMRGREFIMKDAYSFHAGAESLAATYDRVCAAYRAIFDACRLDSTTVEADTGTIGGSSSHEFMVLASTGESAVVTCRACGYAANVEKAEAAESLPAPAAPGAPRDGAPRRCARSRPPGCAPSKRWAARSASSRAQLVKTLIYDADGRPVAVAVRGDHEVNEIKLAHALGAREVRLADDATVARATGAPTGLRRPDRPRRRRSAAGRSRDARAWRLRRRRQPRRRALRRRGVGTRRRARPRGPTCAPCAAATPVRAAARAARGAPRHRGRARVHARHQVLAGDERHLHRRGRGQPSVHHGLLRPRHQPHRGGRDRAEPRRQRHHLAAAARSVPGPAAVAQSPRTRRCAARPTSSTTRWRRRASRSSTTTATSGPASSSTTPT